MGQLFSLGNFRVGFRIKPGEDGTDHLAPIWFPRTPTQREFEPMARAYRAALAAVTRGVQDERRPRRTW